MAGPSSRRRVACQPSAKGNIAVAPSLSPMKPMEAPMTDQPIDPAATPEDPNAPEIAADDAGASAIAERAAKQAANDDDHADGEGV